MKRALPILLVALAAGCGGGEDDKKAPASERPKQAGPEQGRVERAFGREVPGSRGRVKFIAPSWRRVRVLSGRGDATHAFTIDREAVQWRVRWECEGKGRLELELPTRAGRSSRGGATCPTTGTGASVKTGQVEISVKAADEWRMVVEQQLHDAVREPPPAEVANGSARTLARGEFYEVAQPGNGTAVLYRLRDGRLLVRLERFRTLATSGLVVWASDHPRPRTSQDAFRSKHVKAATLRASAGEQNYRLPRGVRAGDVRSIVIWCEPLRIAYIAAALAAP